MSESPSPTAQRPRLLDVLRETARRQGHSEETTRAFATWVTLFVQFHEQRYPRDLELADFTRFLEWLGRVPASRQLLSRRGAPRWNSCMPRFSAVTWASCPAEADTFAGSIAAGAARPPLRSPGVVLTRCHVAPRIPCHLSSRLVLADAST
jgi:hypothetical protein